MSETDCRLDTLPRPFALCVPTDAISADPREAVDFMRELGLRHCELRSVGGLPILDMGASRWRQLAASLHGDGMDPVLLDTDVGQDDLNAAFGPQMARLERALDAAGELGTPAIGVFSFHVADANSIGAGDEVADRLHQMAERAAESQVTLLVENLPGTYGHSGVRLGALLDQVQSPFVGVLFNPAGFVARKEHPFLGAFMPGHLKGYVRCLRIRDARFEDGQPVLPDRGNGDLRELISALSARSFDGYFSLDFGLPASAASFRAGYRAFQDIVETLL